MIPYLVAPPALMPVSLAAMTSRLRVTHDDDNLKITAMQADAVAMLDGWGGILGRCIMPQTWAIDVTGPGPHLLPFPDASNVVAVSGLDTLASEVSRTSLGPCVTVADATGDQEITISATYGMSADRLPAVQNLIKLMVQREYDMMAGAPYDAATRSIDALISALRWRRI